MTSIPRFINPYTLKQDFEFVSRADLFDDAEPSFVNGAGSSRAHEYDSELKTLDELLLASWEGVLPRTSTTISNGAEENERRPKKRKRHNDDENVAMTLYGGVQSLQTGGSQFQFRLLSQPRLINLQPKFLERVSIERTCEDGPLAAKLRAQRAEDVSVDAAWVEAQSRMTFSSLPGRPKHLALTLTTSPFNPSLPKSPLVLLEGPKQPNRLAKVQEANSDIPCRTPTVRCCDVVEYRTCSDSEKLSKWRTSHRRHRLRCPRKGRRGRGGPSVE